MLLFFFIFNDKRYILTSSAVEGRRRYEVDVRILFSLFFSVEISKKSGFIHNVYILDCIIIPWNDETESPEKRTGLATHRMA
jgi:hypothetical protein